MSNDAAKPLQTPIVKGGLRRIPFFNGRVLTAEDLKTEQDANATERRRLGRALGTGVLDGLFLKRQSDTTVTVLPGRALAPSGRVVELPKETNVSIVSRLERDGPAGTKTTFKSCEVPKSPETSGTGAYLLFVEPASEPSGRTPRTRLGGDGAAGECGAQHRLEGARLRLVYLDTSDDALVPSPLADGEGEYDIQNLSEKVSSARENDEEPMSKHVSKLRNLLAHVCLGTPTTAGWATSLSDAFRGRRLGPVRYGPVDNLRQEDKLSNDAVPIGLLYWSRDRIEFVDVWAVRRRVHRRELQTRNSAPNHGGAEVNPATDRRRAEAEAAVFQFHEHVDALRARDVSVSQTDAERLFAYLPPIGMVGEGVPIARPNDAELPDLPPFFDGLTAVGPSFTEPQRLRALVDEGLTYPPLPINSSLPPDPRRKKENGPLVWVYLLAPNTPQVGADTPFIFTTGYAPFLGDAQFNLSRANQATFSSSAGPPGGS